MAVFRQYVLHFITFTGLLGETWTYAQESGLREYCIEEDLHIQCSMHEMVLMQSALFGRMKIGRCIQSDLGFLGCHTNVLSQMDDLCSGKQSCKMVKIVKGDFHDAGPSTDKCHRELDKYLEVQHMCVYSLEIDNVCRKGNKVIDLKVPAGFVYSENLQSMGCWTGHQSSSMNFIVSTAQGQQLNVTLVDLFADESSKSYSCVHYGSVVEVKTEQQKSICGGQERTKWLMLTNSNRVEIRLQRYGNRKYMLGFQAVGCPDLSAPTGGQLSREGPKLTIRCLISDQTWHLTCEGNRWNGVIGNCSSALPKIAQAKHHHSISVAISSEVWLALIIAIVVIVCVSAATFGVVYWRRRSLEAEIAKMKANSLQRKGKGGKDQDEAEYMFPNFRPRSTMSETEDAVYDFCFSPGSLPKAVPNNQVATSVTLPCRGTSNLQYNNAIMVPAAPESPKYKTLVFIKP